MLWMHESHLKRSIFDLIILTGFFLIFELAGLRVRVEFNTATAATINATPPSLANCNSQLTAGGICVVAAGTYTTAILPANSGTNSQRITYSCPSLGCTIKVTGTTLDLHGKSFVTVDGFTFDGGTVLVCGRDGGTNQNSNGIILDHVATIDSNGAGFTNNASIALQGGCANPIIRNFNFYLTPSDSPTSGSNDVFGISPIGTLHVTNLLAQNGEVRGGWNGLGVSGCDDCVFDGITFWGSKNHQITIGSGNSGQAGLDEEPHRTTIRNSKILSSSVFGETPISTRTTDTITLLNNAIILGLYMPSIGHENQLSGTVTIRNNVIYTGTSSGDPLITLANNAPLTWDIDYNAYVGAGNFNSVTPFWHDLRNATDVKYYPDKDADGTLGSTANPNSEFNDWQQDTGFDRHSIVIADKDWRQSTAQYAGQVWGPNAPIWSAYVDSCNASATTFTTGSGWGSPIAANDKLVYEKDTTVRSVQSSGSSGLGGSCSQQISFSPGLGASPSNRAWFLSWGKQPTLPSTITAANLSFVPQTGSPIIDTGDPALCGHSAGGSGCDMGPVEFGTVVSQSCSDGTPTNSCKSGSAPTYCNASQQLVSNCTTCGCPTGTSCQTDGSCAAAALFSATPLMDMTAGQNYLGFSGGLYPNNSNSVPATHNTEGLTRAGQIVPLDANGAPSAAGKIVFLALGMSNGTREFCATAGPTITDPTCNSWSFMGQAAANNGVDKTKLIMIDGAMNGQGADAWVSDTAVGQSGTNIYTQVANIRLTPKGVTEKQVQAIWYKAALKDPTTSLTNGASADAYQVLTDFGLAMRAMKKRYPNLKQVFMSNRIYGGYAISTLNPEPYAYENNFAVKWLIEAQINQIANGTIESHAGDLNYKTGVAPWIVWGPNLWASGTTPRSDGLLWNQCDLDPSDYTHPGQPTPLPPAAPTCLGAEQKVGTLLLNYFLNSPYATWFKTSGTTDTQPPTTPGNFRATPLP